MGILGVRTFSNFIVIVIGVILAFILYLFLLSASKEKKKEKLRKEYIRKIDIMDRVKPGEIELNGGGKSKNGQNKKN